MTAQEINNTLNKLHYTLMKREHETYYGEIRVRIGRELLRRLFENIINQPINYIDCTEAGTIFGHPLEIAYDNPMCLEIHVVEKVPVYEESEEHNDN